MTKTQLLKSAKIISFPVLVCNDPLLKLFPLLREGGTLYFFSSLSFPRLLALSVLVCDIVSSWEREMKMLGYGFESKWGMPILVFVFMSVCDPGISLSWFSLYFMALWPLWYWWYIFLGQSEPRSAQSV